MEPQNLAFNPHNDIWRFNNDMVRFQQVQAEHGERLSRLERRQEEDARMKSVWGASSPFPSVLGGTPQQLPLQHPPNEPFSTFDDDQNNLMGSLHLDPNEEPRRIGATSRANSVRFDESANQGWSHTSRSSIDLIPRTGSGLGGHAMSERTYSHKSDGRQSSAGHSVHSATSGRANSLGIDTLYGNQPSVSPLVTPGLAPGLFILGSVPSIIRCWLNTNFKHDSLLYAAVCTGSYTSFVDIRLVESLGFLELIEVDDDGLRTIKLAVYLPEAIQHPASSRSASPAPQIPSFTVRFTVTERNAGEDTEPKAMQIFLGSDILRAHNADILFSSNTMTMFDDDRVKLSIPLVRPENERTFNTLGTGSCFSGVVKRKKLPEREVMTDLVDSEASPGTKLQHLGDVERDMTGASSDDGIVTTPSSGRHSLEQRPIPGLISTKTHTKDAVDSGTLSSSTPRTSPAIWSNWRRDNEKPTAGPSMDWAGASKGAAPPSYQRRDTGIKVLKPVKSLTRTASGTAPGTGSPTVSQSRFFDDGKRRTSTMTAGEGGDLQLKRVVPTETRTSNPVTSAKENTPTGSKPRATNPIGGASAFAWLNSSGRAK